MIPNEAAQFMAEVFAMWTNPDSHARRAVIETHFHDSVHFYNRGGEFIGHAGLETLGDMIQSRFPGARFTLAQPPQTLGNAIRAYWQIGPPDNPQAVSALYALVDENS